MGAKDERYRLYKKEYRLGVCIGVQSLPGHQLPRCCPLRGQCHKVQGNRIVDVNHRLKAHKEQADRLLNSEQGICYRKKRALDVEPVFANIKSNHSFKRFLLKGMTKAEVEIGLLSIDHNLRKWKV